MQIGRAIALVSTKQINGLRTGGTAVERSCECGNESYDPYSAGRTLLGS
jgi:hypothetical protein